LWWVLGCPSAAHAQAAGQLWGNAIVNWLASPVTTYELDIEPKSQLLVHEGQATWIDLDITPHVRYAVAPWVDVLGEVDVGLKHEGTDVNTITVTPRVGAQLHILSRVIQHTARSGAEREAHPRRRLDIGTLLRLERETTHSTADPRASSWRLRDRFALAYPMNRPKVTSDGAVYFTSDIEEFMPVDEAVKGGAIGQVRIRTGVGYRRSFAWRFDALYIWNAERNKESGVMAVDSHAIDVRVKRQF